MGKGGMVTDETEEREVTAGDQADINAFSRLNVNLHDLQDDLKEKKDILVNLQDASNEVMMILDDTQPVKMAVGEAYADVSQEEATERIDAMVEETEEAVALLESQVKGVQEKMRELKGRLSLKFGSNINLEEDD
ncbi:hypothetical protein T484DRAFT_1928001 [Baffinella frigidus]|nr:hypothetical protein T484DRAFT_1928001 [Cryptophyta sp. CCMP2293]